MLGKEKSWDVALLDELEAARQGYKRETDEEDWRCFDLDAAKVLLSNLSFEHPQLTMAWLRAAADHIPYLIQSQIGPDPIPTRTAEGEAYAALRFALLGRH